MTISSHKGEAEKNECGLEGVVRRGKTWFLLREGRARTDERGDFDF